ncbi:flavin reductase family protein [Streptomyces cylindrosporus]|uniref:Flavin reductase family protein n=1 Tax=Streptomyces cylindrosporus TaxID=2927583 RepID=A0ABS9YCW9_9ACTN|nr:flavin reductase family protein [Streptomyces cylindrosporus]MCI3275040.1 flavin reductase family protein [Streptomyces cylindrosporus]
MTTVPPLAVGGERLRACLSQWPSGVAVVTTVDSAGVRRGFTATSFSALSMDPPLVLVCLDRGADCKPAFDTATAMAIHVLRDDQSPLARLFATKGHDKYDGLRTSPGLDGVPLLAGTLARIECALDRRIPAGDHVILVGLVRRARVFPGRPLVHHARAFHTLTGRPPREARNRPDDEHDGYDRHDEPGDGGEQGG